MTTQVSPEMAARKILGVFRSDGVSIGGALMMSRFTSALLSKGTSRTEFESGLQFAIDRGWIEKTNTMLILAREGYIEM